MSSFHPALELVWQTRADTAVLALFAAGVCARVRRTILAQPGSVGFPRGTVLAVAAIVVAGALLAESTAVVIGYPASATLLRLMLARTAVLGAAALASAVLLVLAVRIGRLRAKLRAHTDVERQLQAAVTAADQANRAKSDFLAVMGHEIRTPLNAVMGFANLLAETRLDEAQRGYVTTITNEGARLGALINDLLDLTKMEQGRLTLERLPFSPVETTREVLALFGPRALERNVALRFEPALAAPLLVSGDPLRCRQILVNLVDNAIKFTPRGTVTVSLTWSPPAAPAVPGRLAIRVRDTGIGIPEDRREDLFQMFTQADPSTTRRYGGTGLGLAICHRLVTLMGGEIGVTSTPGEGTEFAFTLPMTAVAFPIDLAG